MTKIIDRSAMTPCAHQSAAPSPDYGGGQAANTDRAAPMVRERVPWRPAAASLTAIGTAVGIGMLHPMLGEIAVIIELAVALTIIGAALFGTPDLNDRAFRLLRWVANRPEPPVPEASGAGEGRPLTPSTQYAAPANEGSTANSKDSSDRRLWIRCSVARQPAQSGEAGGDTAGGVAVQAVTGVVVAAGRPGIAVAGVILEVAEDGAGVARR